MSDAMRMCARCHVAKPLEDFPIKNAARGTRRSYCLRCCREYGREHYRNNVAMYVRKAAARAAIERTANRAFVWNYLLTHPCVDCGERDPIVLEFDHREPRTKFREVARLVHTHGLSAVRAEIAKCDVRCGNCHRIRTATQFGWYRLGETQVAYLA